MIVKLSETWKGYCNSGDIFKYNLFKIAQQCLKFSTVWPPGVFFTYIFLSFRQFSEIFNKFQDPENFWNSYMFNMSTYYLVVSLSVAISLVSKNYLFKRQSALTKIQLSTELQQDWNQSCFYFFQAKTIQIQFKSAKQCRT